MRPSLRSAGEIQQDMRRYIGLSKERDLTSAEEGEFEALLAEADQVNTQYRLMDAVGAAPGQINRGNPFDAEIRDYSPRGKAERRDAALRVVEQRAKERNWAPRQEQHMEQLLRSGHSVNLDSDLIAARLLATESDAYHSAFFKAVTEPAPAWTPEENRAMGQYREVERRAASEGTDSAGGYGIPVLIDPTIVLTSGAADAPILSISTMKTITTKAWKGVTSTGLVFEYTQEASVVADKTPTLAQPVIPVYRADAYIPYSFELAQDYPAFAEEFGSLLEQGYVNLVASGTMTGSGSNQPTGIFTALKGSGGNCANGTSGKVVALTTLGTLGAVDVRAAWSQLSELFRQRASWVMNVTVESIIRAFGNNLALSDFTADLTAQGIDKLVSRPIALSDYAPEYSTATTTVTQYCVIGDFSKFYIVQRAGMVVEQIPVIFDQATGRPTGQRGLLAWSRHGYNALDSNPFRVLSNGG
ncbi:MAG: phage major capsid protein [Candidatus Dormiibacterota bacterium]